MSRKRWILFTGTGEERGGEMDPVYRNRGGEGRGDGSCLQEPSMDGTCLQELSMGGEGCLATCEEMDPVYRNRQWEGRGV
jgi:hypothetical protein